MEGTAITTNDFTIVNDYNVLFARRKVFSLVGHCSTSNIGLDDLGGKLKYQDL